MTNSILPSKFGPYGGQFVPETLIPALEELEEAFVVSESDSGFQRLLAETLRDYVGRPTPITYAKRLSASINGAQIYFKREDLCHTGAHKINNAVGQALLAKKMGKFRIVAETGAGQHGVASATVCAWLGLECVVYMGEVDIARQKPNVSRMRLLGAEVRPVTSGSRTLKDAINEAIRDWVTNVDSTHYLLGSALGPHPYPTMVKRYQSVIGKECREQFFASQGDDPDAVIACVGGGSNAIGIFSGYLDKPDVQLFGVEAGGNGISSGKHASRFGDPSKARIGVIHGTKTFVLQDDDGQVMETHSISAGLDYPAVGPEHAQLRDQERVMYSNVTDEEALTAFHTLSRLEGILPALESAHAVAYAIQLAQRLPKSARILVNLSGRGDKDLDTILNSMEANQ